MAGVYHALIAQGYLLYKYNIWKEIKFFGTRKAIASETFITPFLGPLE
jgi:hypothetical protein